MIAKKYRLKKNSEFSFVYKKGKNLNTKHFVLVFARSRYPSPRIGFVVSKKVGNSVKRNQIKRKLRSAFNPLLTNIKPNFNYIIIARQGIENYKSHELSTQIKTILEKNNLLKGE